ncbi:MAG: retron system putative HNH endonuclease [Planococcus donghaensis]
MKKVQRSVEPNILAINKLNWTSEFINEVKRNRGYTGMNTTIRDRYNNPEIKKFLKDMYNGKCCYCENSIGREDYENIEHLKPKSAPNFHMLTFYWRNLHWSCGRCNKNKRAKWNSHYPILDPTKDNPEKHLKMNIVTGEIANKTRRGKTTINHAQLNRDKLVEARKRIIDKLNLIFLMVQSTPTLKDDEYLKLLLEEFVNEDAEFGTLIKTYVDKMSLI